MRNAVASLVLLVCVTWSLPFDSALATAQGGTITGSVKVRERANDDESLLVAVTGATDKPVSRLELELGDRLAWQIGHVPVGWKADIDGRRLKASGPPAANVHLRFDAPPREQAVRKLAGKQCELRAWSGNELVHNIKSSIVRDFKVGTQYTLEDAIVLPPIVAEYDPFVATPTPNFRNGEWKLIVPDTAAAANLATPSFDAALLDRWKAAMYGTGAAPAGASGGPITGLAIPEMRFSFIDVYRELLLDSKANWYVPTLDRGCSPDLKGGTPLAFAGKPACVTGCFDEVGRALQILLDDKDPVVPLAFSRSSIVVNLPQDMTPGLHTLSLRDGKASLGSHTLRVMQLQGSIDQSELWRGQGTTMRLHILGHDQPVPIAVINRTPAIINVEGGVRQTVTTAGGAPNGVTRSVLGIQKGDFAIDYSLDLPPCGLPK